MDMVAGLHRFADLLRASPSSPATLRADAIPDERHATVGTAAYTRGIVALYGARWARV